MWQNARYNVLSQKTFFLKGARKGITEGNEMGTEPFKKLFFFLFYIKIPTMESLYLFSLYFALLLSLSLA